MSDRVPDEKGRLWGSPVLERGRRMAGAASGNAIVDLRVGMSCEAVAQRRGLPLATVEGIQSFYELLKPGPRVCDGTSCHFAGSERLARRLAEVAPVSAVRCLGHCYSAPAFQSGERVLAKPSHTALESWIDEWGETGEPHEDFSPIPRSSLADPPIVLRNVLGFGAAEPFADYELPGGEEILRAVEASGLRGRGGAAFPTGAKWKSARDTAAPVRYVVANGDEGDPGSFVDRLLLEEDPHAVLAGMVACARAIGARRGVVYVRGEYPRARAVVLEAIDEARAQGWLGPEFDVEVVSGAGSYICGEETALLRSIEGLRGEPRVKPPFPTEVGLFGMPTVVQNVETLAVVPWVARSARVSGTKAVSLCGAVNRPGVVEVPFGTPLRQVLEAGGGGVPAGRRWRMALVGGPMGRVVPESKFDTPLGYDTLPGMGHGGIVAFDESVAPRALAEHLFAFAAAESCGTCTPCRVGTPLLAHMPDRLGLERLLDTMEFGSLCGFGQGVPRPIRDLLQHFGDEVFS